MLFFDMVYGNNLFQGRSLMGIISFTSITSLHPVSLLRTTSLLLYLSSKQNKMIYLIPPIGSLGVGCFWSRCDACFSTYYWIQLSSVAQSIPTTWRFPNQSHESFFLYPRLFSKAVDTMCAASSLSAWNGFP